MRTVLFCTQAAADEVKAAFAAKQAKEEARAAKRAEKAAAEAAETAAEPEKVTTGTSISSATLTASPLFSDQHV